jgi:hypothetical protein
MNLTGERPPAIQEFAQQLLPALILVFKGLKRAYESRSKEDESDDEEGAEEGDDEELEDEDDIIDTDNDQYMSKLDKVTDDDYDEYEDDEDDDDAEETALESYETPLDKEDTTIDEYLIFKSSIEQIEQADKVWYEQLVGALTEEQRKDIEEIFRLAEQRRAAAESKKIEQAGGYNFTQVQVPNNFNFTSP